MSILEVKNLSHGFGDRAIFEDVSFRLLKGEHIGLVGANGEGKSTFMSIVTGKMLPDEGKVEWSKYVTAGYLDQHSVLAERQSVRDVLRTAFDELFKAEARINDLYMKMAEDGADVDALMEEVGELQDRLESRDFYTLDAKIDEVARALGVMDFGMDTDVTSLSGGQRTKCFWQNFSLKSLISCCWTSRPTTWMLSILIGSSAISKTMRMPLFSFRTIFHSSMTLLILSIMWKINS